MAGVRELLAVGLGVLLGVALLAKPKEMLLLSVFVGPNQRRRHGGEYGNDDDDPFGTWALWFVRVVGLACLLVAAYIAYAELL